MSLTDTLTDYVAQWQRQATATRPANRARAEAGIRQVYAQLGHTPPAEIIWCAGPATLVLTAALYQTRTATGPLLTEALQDDLVLRMWEATHRVASSSTEYKLEQYVRQPLKTRLNRLIPTIEEMMEVTIRWMADNGQAPTRIWQATQQALGEAPPVEALGERAEAFFTLKKVWEGVHPGQWSAAQLAYYAAFNELLGVSSPTEPLNGLIAVARSAGHFLAYGGVCFISERPTALRRDARQRLHNDNGPAVAFRDGLRRSYIGGVRVPNWLTEQPHLLTVERIDAETNVEVRRIMLERYGWERFLRESDAEEVHRDLTGTLYRRPIPGDEDLVMVRVVNKTPEPDGTYKEYFLRVPPTMQTAHQAVAWTFGLRPEEYHPLRET